MNLIPIHLLAITNRFCVWLFRLSCSFPSLLLSVNLSLQLKEYLDQTQIGLKSSSEQSRVCSPPFASRLAPCYCYDYLSCLRLDLRCLIVGSFFALQGEELFGWFERWACSYCWLIASGALSMCHLLRFAHLFKAVTNGSSCKVALGHCSYEKLAERQSSALSVFG